MYLHRRWIRNLLRVLWCIVPGKWILDSEKEKKKKRMKFEST